LSRSVDPASTSIDRQRDHIETFAAQHDTQRAGPAMDKATSAILIPPEKRKAVKERLDRPEDLGCAIYWRPTG